MDNDRTMYLVTCNGWREGYGSYIYCIGVFDNNEKAEEAKSKAPEDTAEITELTMNSEHPMRSCDFPCEDSYENDLFLGGYAE